MPTFIFIWVSGIFVDYQRFFKRLKEAM